MTRLYRPYIPLSVRVAVAERQLGFFSPLWGVYCHTVDHAKQMGQPLSLSFRLKLLLGWLFPDGQFQLDHDPALEQRKRRGTGVNTRYSPPANAPECLFYRSKDEHLEKTTGRKPGAAKTVTSKGSDVWVAQKFRRLEGKTKPKRKQKIASRPFQKGKRKIHGSRKFTR